MTTTRTVEAGAGTMSPPVAWQLHAQRCAQLRRRRCRCGDCHAAAHCPRDLIRLFNLEFAHSHQTVLVRGQDEPLYLPADAGNRCHRVVFAHGYYASALHEIAHWCLAGPARRQRVDYGYWYTPAGRDAAAQRRFEAVEVRPQAIEALLSAAAGFAFAPSADNPGEASGGPRFAQQVERQVDIERGRGLPPRAACFMRRLRLFYRTPTDMAAQGDAMAEDTHAISLA